MLLAVRCRPGIVAKVVSGTVPVLQRIIPRSAVKVAQTA
jgi:hypothetical protein